MMNSISKFSNASRILVMVLVLGLITLITVMVGYQIIRQRDFALLDRVLKKQVDDPKILLQILCKSESELSNQPYGLTTYEVYDVQHLALVRLLELQKARFGGIVIAHTEECDGRDTAGADLVGRNRSGNFIISGTPSLNADYTQGYKEDYWRIELFEFTPEGHLLRRECYTDDTEKKLLKNEKHQ